MTSKKNEPSLNQDKLKPKEPLKHSHAQKALNQIKETKPELAKPELDKKAIAEIMELIASQSTGVKVIDDTSQKVASTNENEQELAVILQALFEQAKFDPFSSDVSLKAITLFKQANLMGQFGSFNLDLLRMQAAKLLAVSQGDLAGGRSYFFYEQYLSGRLGRFFEHYFTNVEGFICSSDKAHYTVNQMRKSLTAGNLSLQDRYDYGEGLTEAYWAPKTIMNTEGAFGLYNAWDNVDLSALRAIFKEVSPENDDHVEK